MIFKHKWIYYALSVLIASISAHESAWLLFLLFPLVIIAIVKKFSIVHKLSLVIFCIACFCYFSFQLQNIEKPVELPTTLTWTSEYKINGNMLRGFMKDSDGRKVYVQYKFQSEEEKLQFESTSLVGKRFFIEGELVEPARPAHAYSFRMTSYLKSKGAKGVVEIVSLKYVGTKKGIIEQISVKRFLLQKHIEETFPESLFAEAQALIIGLQDHVDDEMRRAYQKLGITHLFAISGLHIGILSFLFYEGLLRLNIRREFATILLMIVLPLYAILAGSAPSVWRAVIVVELIIISKWKRQLSIDDALAISFIGFVLVEPWVIYQIGFQLSYLATASLIYSSRFLSSIASWWKQSFFITFVCQLIVYPLLLFHFYELSISSFIVNIIYVPLFSFVIIPINILLLIFSFLPSSIVNIVFAIYEPLRLQITKGTFFLQSLPYQMWIPGKPTLLNIFIAYVSVFVTFYFIDMREKWWKVVLVLMLPVVFLQFQWKMNPHLVISFVDVGQGDCIVIELPYRRKVYVIDSGGVLRFQQEAWKERRTPYEVGRQVVVPYLKGKGISTIDKLILSHADSDHVEGAEEILKEIRVKEIHVTPSSLMKPVMEDLLNEAKQQKVPIKEQIAGEAWHVGDVSFQYVWPFDTEYEGNNDSLVLYLKKNDFEALFTGDLEKEGEAELIERFSSLSNIDLLKAGHHGSKTSSSEEFIQKLMPIITIFCAGENNPFGHPHEEVLERFQRLGLKTITTGEVGTIEIVVKDEQMEVRTFSE